MGAAASLGSPASAGAGPAASVGAGQAAQATAALAQVGAPALPPIAPRLASTWPRGWMAAAVPQQVREFNVQISRAQLALQFAADFSERLHTLERLAQRQASLPSAASQARSQAALAAARSLWAERHACTLGSVDETLAWSPTAAARQSFVLGGWTAASLQAASAADRELVAFCLLGQDQEYGAWVADTSRSPAANRFALACALAPLGVQLDDVSEGQILISVEERRTAYLTQRLVARGGGRRFPAGQWQAPLLGPNPQAVALPAQMDEASVAALLPTLAALHERLARLRAVLQQFQQQAGASLTTGEAPLARLQGFAQRFADAGQLPAYDWVLAVVPAVRALARPRVSRLLRRVPT